MRVLIADDHRLILDGIRRALEADGGFEIVGETQQGTQVLPLVARTGPELVLLDLRMPNMDGLACLDEIRSRHPDVKVIMLSASTSPELIETALRRGRPPTSSRASTPPTCPRRFARRSTGTSSAPAGLPEGDESIGAKAAG